MKVKVRIAVAVDPTGDWSSSGWKGAKDNEMLEFASETVAQGEAYYFLEAEIEVPEAKVVQAVVTPTKEGT